MVERIILAKNYGAKDMYSTEWNRFLYLYWLYYIWWYYILRLLGLFFMPPVLKFVELNRKWAVPFLIPPLRDMRDI